MSDFTRAEWIALWKSEEQQPFVGWDFSYLAGRVIEDETPWSYPERAAQRMKQASSLLDMDTGGGERLLEMAQHWPARVVATESYAPNVQVARERLAPRGVTVVDLQLSRIAPMPFADNEFDLVLNRHSTFNSGELARILTPGGTFLTQQVHGLWAHDLLAAFDVEPLWPDNTAETLVQFLKEAGFTIVTAQDWTGVLRFTDVAALVYYLKAVPWTVPGFSVETHEAYLWRLHEGLGKDNPLSFVAKKFLIEARLE